MMNRKNISVFVRGWHILICMFLISSCKPYLKKVRDTIIGVPDRPDAISNIKVTNVNGGARISYMLPQNDSINYVLAKFTINVGAVRETKSGRLKNTIAVEGFSQSRDYEVALYAIDIAGRSSAPVIVHVHPYAPPYLLTAASIKVNPDFGGINVQLSNKLKKPMTVMLTSFDSISGMTEIRDQHYLTNESAGYSVRGLLPGPNKLGIYVVDGYGNTSPIVKYDISPFPETLLDKSKFKAYKLASDSEIGFNWPLTNLWDGHTDGNSDGWHTNLNIKLPAVCTFDLGVKAKLFRFVVWERPDQYAYTAGNPKEFSMWGSIKSNPRDSVIPLIAPVGTVVGDWVNLGNFQYPSPPSGLKPSMINADDNIFVKAGVNFNVPLNNKQVKFIRIAVKSNWSGQNYAHLMEVAFYGSLK